MIIEAVKSALPFEVILHDAGVNLSNGKAPCPFHADKTPSFTVKGERGRCWTGCFNGDVIDFTAKYYGLDFKSALRLLAERAGIKRGRTPAEVRAAEKAQKERERKKRLVSAFREWEQKTVNEIAEVLRGYRYMKATRTTYTEAELVTLAELRGNIEYLENLYFDVFCRKDDEPKFGLYRETKNAGCGF